MYSKILKININISGYFHLSSSLFLGGNYSNSMTTRLGNNFVHPVNHDDYIKDEKG